MSFSFLSIQTPFSKTTPLPEVTRFQNSPNLIKTHKIQLATNIYPLWADAEDANFFQPSLCINDASSHSSRECWRHRDRDNVKRLNDDGASWNLQQRSELMNKNSLLTDSLSHWCVTKSKTHTLFSPVQCVLDCPEILAQSSPTISNHNNPVPNYPQPITSNLYFSPGNRLL